MTGGCGDGFVMLLHSILLGCYDQSFGTVCLFQIIEGSGIGQFLFDEHVIRDILSFQREIGYHFILIT